MRSKWCIILIISIQLLVTACGDTSNSATEDNESYVDLTELSSIVVYVQACNMLANSEEYIGIDVKIPGTFYKSSDSSSGEAVYYLIVSDEAGCCMQLIEFVLEDEDIQLEDLAHGTEIVVEGEFDISERNGMKCIQLKDCTIEW